MIDRISKEKRSFNMRAIKSKNTKPEILVRKILHKNKYRFRLHSNLIGKPDITLSKYKTVIFINGCFWHGHGCHLSRTPQTNKNFWINKLKKNKLRDKKVKNKLLTEGWKIMIIWECNLRGKYKLNENKLIKLIKSFLEKKDVFFSLN